MTNPNDTYTSPLASRNASEAMLRIWSPRHKFNTWRRVWLAVAEAQHEVTKDWGSKGARSESDGPGRKQASQPGTGSSGSSGPLVTKEQVEALRAVVERGITDAEIERAAELERELRHDVMAHVHCLGESCPEAKGIIHLGCTSQDVVCNADVLTIREAQRLVDLKLDRLLHAIGQSAGNWKGTPTLGFTHYQPAQPTTVGRRLAEWGMQLVESNSTQWPKYRGLRGATGTQASFLALFEGDQGRVDECELRFLFQVFNRLDDPGIFDSVPAQFEEEIDRIRSGERPETGICDSLWMYTHTLTGQTYPRVSDARTLGALAETASVLHKIATDIRLLSNRKELDEPFGDKQIGSSAMPYKRNPMKCERICGLTRFVMNLVGNAYDTAATQWLERTLDDSSNRRLSLPESFLALDGALDLMHEVASGLVVHEAMVRRNLMAELPFLATENILMEAVKAGGDRQDLHEKIRIHAQAAGMRVKSEGLDNDLIDRLRADPAFAGVHHLLTEEALLDPMKYIGRAVEQTERFLAEVVEPLRERYKDDLDALGSSDRGV